MTCAITVGFYLAVPRKPTAVLAADSKSDDGTDENGDLKPLSEAQYKRIIDELRASRPCSCGCGCSAGKKCKCGSAISKPAEKPKVTEKPKTDKLKPWPRRDPNWEPVCKCIEKGLTTRCGCETLDTGEGCSCLVDVIPAGD